MRRAGDKPISVDPASAEFLREVGADNFLAWTQGAAILFPNAEEAAILAGSDDPETQCARLAAHYPLVVVKRGAAGAEAAEGARRWRVKAPKIKAIDTTGAGDAFVAAFLAARLSGADIQPALERAAAAGAAASAIVGGTADEVERSSRPIDPITSFDRLATFALYTYLRRQHGFRLHRIRQTSSVSTLDERQYFGSQIYPVRPGGHICPFVPSSASASPFRPWRGRASSCAAPSASATRPISTRSS